MIIHKDMACHCTWLVTTAVAVVDACDVVQQQKSRTQKKYNITAAGHLPDAADSSHMALLQRRTIPVHCIQLPRVVQTRYAALINSSLTIWIWSVL